MSQNQTIRKMERIIPQSFIYYYFCISLEMYTRRISKKISISRFQAYLKYLFSDFHFLGLQVPRNEREPSRHLADLLLLTTFPALRELYVVSRRTRVFVDHIGRTLPRSTRPFAPLVWRGKRTTRLCRGKVKHILVSTNIHRWRKMIYRGL